jgi:hypothetical protein
MDIDKLYFNNYREGTFFIRDEHKISGMTYGFIILGRKEINGFTECIDLLKSAYPIPQDLRERVEKRLLPRFYEIQDFITHQSSLQEEIKVEISKINHKDILYGLESSAICKLLEQKGFKSSILKDKVGDINFNTYF